MDFSDERTAIDTRLAAAILLAQAVDASFVLIQSDRNKQHWVPDGDTKAIRAYVREVRSERQGMSEGFDRYWRMLFTQIIVPQEIGDALVSQIWEAIEPSFQTNGDGLHFEEAPSLSPGTEDDATCYLAVGSFPYYFDRLRA